MVTSDALRWLEPDLQTDEASVLGVFDRMDPISNDAQAGLIGVSKHPGRQSFLHQRRSTC